MLCVWCKEETPDDSTYCEKCGRAFKDAEAALGLENDPAESDGADLPDAESLEAEEALSDEIVFEVSENDFQASPFDDVEISVDAIERTIEDEPLVEPPSPPIQPKLSKGLVAVVGTIAVLFAAAVILLAWASIMRFLGL